MSVLKFISMIRTLLYCLFFSLLASCDKDKNIDPSTQTLNGRWTLISIEDKTNSQMLAAPQGSAGRIFLQFEGNNFIGQTMVNNIYEGLFEINNTNNEIRVNTYSISKVAENEWGGAFLTVLSSCAAQSISPCKASAITWLSPSTIKIDAPLRYAITLEKF